MALINPSNLYSAGQVVFDSTPYARIAEQRRAKQQALDDTLYKYYSELPNKINPAGLRTIDHDGLNKRLENIRDFGMQNMKEIVRGGAAKQKIDAMFQDAKQYVNQSKDVGLFQTKTGADYFKGKHRPRARDLEIMAAIDKPIDDPEHYKNADIKQPYSYNDFSIAAPDFDGNRQSQFDKALLGGIKPQVLKDSKRRYDIDTFETIDELKYRPEDVFNIAKRAAENIKGDMSALNFYEDQLDNPDAVKKASEALSKMAGVQVLAETAEQMAAGLKADQFINFSKEDRRKNVNAINQYKAEQTTLAYKRRLAALGFNDKLIKGRMDKANNLRKDIIKFRSTNDAAEQEGIINKHIEKSSSKPIAWADVNGERYGEGRFYEPTVSVAQKLSVYGGKDKDGNDIWFTPDAYFIPKDKTKAVPVKFKRDANNKILKSEAGNTLLERTPMKAIPYQNLRVEITKEFIPKKNQGSEIIDEYVGDKDPDYEYSVEHIERGSNQGSSSSKTIKGSTVPKGAKVTQGADGSYYYNGMKIEM